MNKPVNETPPEDESPIAAAIRRKRERRTTAGADLDALEAAVVADIATFDQRAVSLTPEAAPRGVVEAAESSNQFPEIVPEGVERMRPGDSMLQPGTSQPAGAWASDPGGTSLLERLRQQAQVQQFDEASRRRELTSMSRQLDAALRRIFAYSHELFEQLNILKPPIERTYSMLGHIEFSRLQWQEGFVDYRTQAHTAGATYELVSMACQLHAPEELRMERDVIAADKFHKALLENGVIFSSVDVRNARHMVEKVIFSITADVRVTLRWLAHPEEGVLVLETRNLERYGNRSYIIAPDAVTNAMLDQFGRLLLGQSNNFRDYYRH